MLKSVPKTEKTRNAPRREVHFLRLQGSCGIQGRHFIGAMPIGFHCTVHLCKQAELHTGGGLFCFGDQNHEGGSQVEEKDSPAATHTDREKESAPVQKAAHGTCRLWRFPGLHGVPCIHTARIRRRGWGNKCMDKGQ